MLEAHGPRLSRPGRWRRCSPRSKHSTWGGCAPSAWLNRLDIHVLIRSWRWPLSNEPKATSSGSANRGAGAGINAPGAVYPWVASSIIISRPQRARRRSTFTPTRFWLVDHSLSGARTLSVRSRDDLPLSPPFSRALLQRRVAGASKCRLLRLPLQAPTSFKGYFEGLPVPGMCVESEASADERRCGVASTDKS